MAAVFVCENCSKQVKRTDKICKHCGHIFQGLKCPACEYTGSAREFTEGCPVCGYASDQKQKPEFIEVEPAMLQDKSQQRSRTFGSEQVLIWFLVIAGVVGFFIAASGRL